jgi:ubiquinone/menaquinone biosynthesis C-methylase UbiE
MNERDPQDNMYQQRVYDLFEAESVRWTNLYGHRDAFSVIMQDRHALALAFFDSLCLPHEAKILEVGCGAGLMSVALAERGYTVDALDNVQAMTEAARRLSIESGLSDRVKLAIGDVQSLNFGDGRFTVAIALGVVPWLSDLVAALREIARVLRPGGYAIISGDNPWRMNDLIDPALNPFIAPLKRTVRRAIVGLGLKSSSTVPSPRLYTQESFVQDLRSMGLQSLIVKPFGFGPFTVLHHGIFPDATGVRIHRALQNYCDRRSSFLGRFASQYVVLAQKVDV